jgi:hypothetical protein
MPYPWLAVPGVESRSMLAIAEAGSPCVKAHPKLTLNHLDHAHTLRMDFLCSERRRDVESVVVLVSPASTPLK